MNGVRSLRHHRRVTDHRHWLRLPLNRRRDRVSHPRHPPSAHPPVPATDQRQSARIHQNHARRLGNRGNQPLLLLGPDANPYRLASRGSAQAYEVPAACTLVFPGMELGPLVTQLSSRLRLRPQDEPTEQAMHAHRQQAPREETEVMELVREPEPQAEEIARTAGKSDDEQIGDHGNAQRRREHAGRQRYGREPDGAGCGGKNVLGERL